jgi:hypothetical protein
VSVPVPAGNYVVIGQARLINRDGDRQNAVCSINSVVVQNQSMEPVNGSDSEETIVPITSPVSMPSAGNITMACGGFAIHADSLRLTVIKVDTIN